MKAVTLRRPWPWAILVLGKPVENRTWAPPPGLIGRRIGIHSGKGWDEEGARWIETVFRVEIPAAVRHADEGVIVATVRIDSVTSRDADLANPWAAPTQMHWWFSAVCEIEPRVPCRGAQGLWTIPTEVLQHVLANERPVKED